MKQHFFRFLLIIGIIALSQQVFSQTNIQITGKVTGAGGVLPGATILEKGTKNGVLVSSSGNYSIQVKANSTLEFSFIGFKTKEVKVGTANIIDMEMEEDPAMLEAAVVSTGYQLVDRKLFTGSAVRLQASSIKIEGVTDVSRMLEGKAAGVSVSNVSGTFGSAPKIRIRGATSIYGSNKPLWVLDGVILEDIVDVSMDDLSSGDATTLIGSAVAGINSDDIESFQVLKDASATALYGARAMNGVIVITTKKGRSGRAQVSYTGSFTINTKPNYSQYDLMNSADQMSIYAEMSRKGFLTQSKSANGRDGGMYKKMYNLLSADADGNFGLENTPEAKQKFLNRYALANTDWFDILFRNSLAQDHAVSLSAGSDQSQFYASMSFYNDQGWTIADNVKRFTANMNANFNLSDAVNLSLITSGSTREQRAPGTMKRADNVVAGAYERDFDINPFSYAMNTSRAITAYDEQGNRENFTRNYADFNILNELENNYMDINVIDFKMQAELGWKINKNLKYSVLGSVRYIKSTREHNITENANQANAYRAAGTATIRKNNPFLYQDPDNPNEEKVVVLPEGGIYYNYEDDMRNYYLRNQLNWGKVFEGIHNVNVFVGQEIKSTNRNKVYSSGFGYQYDKGGTAFTDYRIIKQMIENNNSYFGKESFNDRQIAGFTTLSYSYDERYTLGLTGRYEGSNQMGKSSTSRWLPTWNVSGAWNVYKENFMKDVTWLQRLSLRSTYGLTASMMNNVTASAKLLNKTTDRPYLTEKEGYIKIDKLANADLTWEKQYEFNIGLDLTTFDGKLNITTDYYTRKSFDLFGYRNVSGIGGQRQKFFNYADMSAEGFELSIGVAAYKDDNFDYYTSFTFSHNSNTITKMEGTNRIYDLVKPEGGPQEGYSNRGLYSVKYTRLDPTNGTPLFINEKGEESNNVYLQSTKTEHLVYEGQIDPKIVGGFSNTLKYKDLTLNVFFSYQFGNKIRLYPYYAARYNDLSVMPLEFKDRWMMPGDEKITNIPSIISELEADKLGSASIYPYNTYNYSDQRVANGGFIRLKTISLAYQLPQKWSKALNLTRLSVQLLAVNPWLIYSDKKLKGQDPEFFSSGGVSMPVAKQYTFTLKVGL